MPVVTHAGFSAARRAEAQLKLLIAFNTRLQLLAFLRATTVAMSFVSDLAALTDQFNSRHRLHLDDVNLKNWKGLRLRR